MEAIIEFIFGNLFFVILLLGALFNFFKRNAGQAEDAKSQKNKGQKPRSESEEKQEEIDWKEIFRHEEPEKKTKTEPVPARSNEPLIVHMPKPDPKVSGESRHDLKEMARQQHSVRKLEAVQPAPRQQKKLQIDFARLTNEDAKRGVIWAEVLGKPRAKRPHSR